MQRLLRADEVSERTGLPRSTVYALAARHAIPHARFGPRAVRFPEQEIERWLASQVRRPEPQPTAS